jgi:KaiC/GvpD/RAD55 family RecA-like ATPase
MIRPGLSPRRKLSVTIEEVTHAFWFDKTEAEVRKFSATVAKILYKDGWRKE